MIKGTFATVVVFIQLPCAKMLDMSDSRKNPEEEAKHLHKHCFNCLSRRGGHIRHGQCRAT